MPEPLLRKSPITGVICEVRYESQAPLDDSRLLRLQNALEAAELTAYTTEEGLQVTAGVGQLQQTPIRRHRFSSVDDAHALVVDRDVFSFQTVRYAGFEAFLAAWAPVAQSLAEIAGIGVRTRVGLRYVNEIRLPGDELEDVRRAVHSSLLSPWGEHQLMATLSTSLQELRFSQADGELALRHGLQRPGAGQSPTYLLDFDHYDQRLRQFDVHAECDRLRRFNATTYDVFRWAVTDEQYDDFDPEERPDD